MINNIDKCFGFVREFGFQGPFAYQINRAFFNDYVKDDLVISVIYDGRFWIEFIRTFKLIPGLNTGETRLHEIDPKQMQFYDLTLLDRKQRIFKSVEFIDFDDKLLWYYSKLLRHNTYVLQGDLSKLKESRRFLKLFRRKKSVTPK
jgi:hypothetical protein